LVGQIGLKEAVSRVTTCTSALAKGEKKAEVSFDSHPHQKKFFG
jgi:hypothetical protein